jgi:hypothetical protein
MKMPNIISGLLSAQEKFDSAAYADCFSNNAVVYDEGRTHKGKEEIKLWNEKANAEYKIKLKPVEFSDYGIINILTAEISGEFAGSPIVLDYCFEVRDGLIDSLEITG